MKKIIHHVHRHIHKVRSHPEHVRQRIFHVAIIVSGVLLAFLWVWSLGRNMTDRNTRAEVKRNLEPLSALKDNLVGGYINLTAAPETQE